MARAQAALADAKRPGGAQHVEAQTSISRPSTGTVYTLDAAPTEFAEAGKLLLEMADLRTSACAPTLTSPIRPAGDGPKVSIQWDAKPGHEWHGHITRLPVTVVTYSTRNVGEVLVDIDGRTTACCPIPMSL